MNQQSGDVYEKASKATLDINSLQEEFENIDEAIDTINTLKTKALKETKEEIIAMKEISQRLESKIHQVENEN